MPAAEPFPRHVLVVGAGLSGLSAAMHLRARGCEVTVLDSAPGVGGVCRDLAFDGVRHDAGPTVLTMPDILRAGFEALDTDLDEHLRLTRLDPAYRARFADGSHIDVGDTVDKTAASIAEACGDSEGDRFTTFAQHCQRLYDVVFEPFMNRDFDTPFGLLGRPLVDLVRLGGFGSMQRQVDRLLHDDRTRRLVSFQALYAGVAPADARALYNVITYMDVVAGVYSPIGGMSAIPTAMATVLKQRGATLELGTPVRSVTIERGRATGVLTDDAFIGADAVVLTCDPADARELLGLAPLRRPLRRSPSCIVVHANVPVGLGGIDAHHTIHFGTTWAETFREIIDDGVPMSDPSILLSAPAMTDGSLANGGMQPAYLLLPCPNEDAAPLDATAVDQIVHDGLQRLSERGVTLDPSQIKEVVDPAEWRRRGMRAGTPFSLSHTFAQTGPFRPRNAIRGLDNVALAGAGTVPGVGVPTVLISGRLAADRLVPSR